MWGLRGTLDREIGQHQEARDPGERAYRGTVALQVEISSGKVLQKSWKQTSNLYFGSQTVFILHTPCIFSFIWFSFYI